VGRLRILSSLSFAVLAVLSLSVLTTNRAQAGLAARTAVSSCAPKAHHIYCNASVTLHVGAKTTHFSKVQCFVTSATEEIWLPTEFLLTMAVTAHGRNGQQPLLTFKVAGKQVTVKRGATKVTLASNHLTGSFSSRTTAGKTVSGSFACK
jgi:hypothetical protein